MPRRFGRRWLLLLAALAALGIHLLGGRSSTPVRAPVDLPPEDAQPRPPELERATKTPSPPSVEPPPPAVRGDPVPGIEPAPPPDPSPAAVPDARPAVPPVASGLASFDDGTPVSNAELSFATPGERLALARTVTNAEGRFRLPVPGFGRCVAWFVQGGLRFHVSADVAAEGTITVPTKELRVVASPSTPGTLLMLASLERPPAAFHQLEGIPAEGAFLPAYRDGNGIPYPGRTQSLDAEVRVRVPVMSSTVLWASSPSAVSELRTIQGEEAPGLITLHLVGTADFTLTLRDEKGVPVPSARLYAFSRASPPATVTVTEGTAVAAGLRVGASYRFRSEEPFLEVVAPNERTAEVGRSIDLQARNLSRTTFVVRDSASRPVVGAAIRMGSDPAVVGIAQATFVQGITDGAGQWTAYAPLTWGSAVVEVAARPPDLDVGTWVGHVPVGEDQRISLGERPYTTLRIQPTDCTVHVARGRFGWNLLATGPIPLGVTDVVQIDSGGRYPWRLLRARELSANEAVVRLEPAVSCRFVADPEVRSLRIMEGEGGTKPLPGLVVIPTAPGRFEVRGFARGTRVGAFGSGGTPVVACTERVEFVADEGLVLELPALRHVRTSGPQAR